MAYKIDRRVEKTKQLLKQSLLEVLKDTDLQSISIKNLCDVAGINRTTFYKHYRSQFELLDEMEADFLQTIESKFASNYKSIPASEHLAHVLEFMKNNMELCNILIENQTDSIFEKRLMMLPAVLQTMEKDPNGVFEEPPYTFDQLFIIDGAYYAIRRWLLNGCTQSPEEIANNIQNITKKLWQYT